MVPEETTFLDNESTYLLQEKPEIPVEKSDGSRLSVWEATKNMGCHLRRCDFSTIF